MKLRVTTMTGLTPAQRDALQRLGCNATPYITRPHELVFAATCESWQEQEFRRLPYVTRVDPMPTYQSTAPNHTESTTKRVKVTYYRTIAGEFEMDVPEGEEGDNVIRSFLQEAPAEKFHIITDDFAEIEDEAGKRCISL